jgi:hypothetical protein
MKLNGLDVIPAKWATKTEFRRVPGGHLNRWRVLAEVRVPAVLHYPGESRVYVHPDLIDDLVASGRDKSVYLAGPMSGLPAMNYPAFHAEAARLRALGYRVENPAENHEPPCQSWEGYMRLALLQMLRCDTIAMLPGWAKSKGATIEHRLAADLGMNIVFASEVTT